jgi:hypothetical protein
MGNVSVSDIPQQRDPARCRPPLPFERGSCDDGRIHAARKTLHGRRAVCDPNLGLSRLGGRFDHDDLDSCLACIIDTAISLG